MSFRMIVLFAALFFSLSARSDSTIAEKYQTAIASRKALVTEIRRSLVGVDRRGFLRSDRAEHHDLTCDERRLYLQKAIARSLSPRAFLKNLSLKNPDVILLGDTHSIAEFGNWRTDFEKHYKELDPTLDCVFVEGEPNPVEEEFYASGAEYHKRYRNLSDAVRAYARDRQLPVTFSEGGSAKLGDEGNLTAFLVGVTTVYVPRYPGADYQTQPDATPFAPAAFIHFREAKHLLSKGLKKIYIDDRWDFKNVDRDLFMSRYIERLFKDKVCHKAIMLAGKGHLNSMKQLLFSSGISVYTVGFQNLNSHHQNWWAPSFIPEPIAASEHPSVLDEESCPYSSSGRPREAFVTVSEEGDAPRLDRLFEWRWNSFDAQLIGPVSDAGFSDPNYSKRYRSPFALRRQKSTDF